MIKYTREELMKMPLKIVRGLDIRTIEEEKLIQEVVNSRASVAQPVVKFNQIVPDIKNGEQEKEWQDKIDRFNSENTPVEAKIALAENELNTIEKEVKEEVIVQPTTVMVDTTKGEIIKPFCDTCDSLGVRHKKVCPKYVSFKKDADNNTETLQ